MEQIQRAEVQLACAALPTQKTLNSMRCYLMMKMAPLYISRFSTMATLVSPGEGCRAMEQPRNAQCSSRPTWWTMNGTLVWKLRMGTRGCPDVCAWKVGYDPEEAPFSCPSSAREGRQEPDPPQVQGGTGTQTINRTRTARPRVDIEGITVWKYSSTYRSSWRVRSTARAGGQTGTPANRKYILDNSRG